MSNPREEWHLDTRRLGRRVLVFDRVESTNTLAAELAQDPAQDSVVLLADEQTSGRGQHGRTWSCPPGAGVLLSALLFPPPAARRPVVLAAWAANAVCETVRRCTDLQAKIKWPNDVLIRGRKVCGILIEQARATVVGIGLNVSQSRESLEELGLEQATSLTAASGKALDRFAVARRLIHHLDEEYDRLCSGDLATLEACWRWRTGLLGKPVLVECRQPQSSAQGQGIEEIAGRLRDLRWDAVEVETSAGIIRVLPEAVQHIRAAEH
jgi:BirA family biotin operon repressor/biotin-[acetyl-CoA-carboxylase] ligase